MSDILQQFEHKQLGKLRMFMRNGEPHFVAADVARALGYGHTADMTRRLDLSERGVIFIDNSEYGVLNRLGFYHVCLSSSSDSARPLYRWVTGECIPRLRGDLDATAADEIVTAVAEAREAIERAFELMQQLGPKVRLAEAVARFVGGLGVEGGAAAEKAGRASEDS